jgi:hypothetical protein
MGRTQVKEAEEIASELDAFVPSRDEGETVQRLSRLLPPGALPQSARLVEALLGLLERFPDADLGAPGPLVHALESIPGYEAQLLGSLARQPTTYTVWMCNRILNASTDPQQEAQWMHALEAAAIHPKANETTRQDARAFLAFQRDEGAS